jgi:hypothetical protein
MDDAKGIANPFYLPFDITNVRTAGVTLIMEIMKQFNPIHKNKFSRKGVGAFSKNLSAVSFQSGEKKYPVR